MANKRTLKKAINLVSMNLFADALAVVLYGPRPKNEVEAILFSIVRLQANYISRISHPEPGLSAKVYFKDLTKHFAAEVSEIQDQLQS
jgi:hypothetical protein